MAVSDSNNVNKPPVIPQDIAERLEAIKASIGEESGKELQGVVEQLLLRIDTAARANPVAASAMFVARPTGYVDAV